MYVRRTLAAKATNDSGTSIQGCNVAASCKLIYAGINMRRIICVSKEAMERLPLSNPEGSLIACPQPYRSLTAAQQSNVKPNRSINNNHSCECGKGDFRCSLRTLLEQYYDYSNVKF
ncbi:Hypothetical_protein [Hexamita inflata]|uniref:Hypothetical_protein n=1 Tax=Hexamita inflata TaxID=28002 RepID=A0ABP1HEK5_9EUKA